MKHIKLIIGIIIFIGFIYLATQNGSVVNDSVQSTGPIKIGFIGPLTGDAAAYGEPFQMAAKLAVKQINEEGGINGDQLEVVYEDGACNGSDSVNAMNKLVNVDDVNVVLGFLCSTEALSAEPIGTQSQIMMIGMGSSPDLSGVSDYFVRTYPSDAKQGEVLADMAYNGEGWRKVAIIQEQTDYALGLNRAFSEPFGNLGGEIIREEYSSDVTDFKTIISKLKAEEPDALFIVSQTPASGEVILKQSQELNWDTRFIVSDAFNDATMLENHKAALEGALISQFELDESNTQLAQFVEEYQAEYDLEPAFLSFSAIMYDSTRMLADGLREFRDNPEELKTWFREVENWMGTSGVIDIQENGDRASGHTAQIIKDGKVVPYDK